MSPERVMKKGIEVIRIKTAVNVEEVSALGSDVEMIVRRGERKLQQDADNL